MKKMHWAATGGLMAFAGLAYAAGGAQAETTATVDHPAPLASDGAPDGPKPGPKPGVDACLPGWTKDADGWCGGKSSMLCGDCCCPTDTTRCAGTKCVYKPGKDPADVEPVK